MEIPFGLMPEGIFCVRMEMSWKYTAKIAMIFNKLRCYFLYTNSLHLWEMVGIITEKTGVLPDREEMVRITRQA